MPLFIAADRARPWIVAFEAGDLDEVAAALAAQPDPDAFEIRAADGAGAGSRDLTPDEAEVLTVALRRRVPEAQGRAPGTGRGG